MSINDDFPRWIMGGPNDPSTAIVPTLLREVAPNLYVGSENATEFMPVTWGTHGALVQLSSSCAPVGEIPTYRWTFNDGGPVPGALLDDVVRFVSQWRAKGPVLVQCQAGLSRSASVAYGLLRVLDGLDHVEAARRIETREERYDRPLVWPRRPTLESVVAWAEAREGADLYRDPRRPMRLEVVVVGRVVVTVFDPIEQTGEVGREMVIALAALERAHGHGGQGPAETPGPSERPCAPSSAATEGAC